MTEQDKHIQRLTFSHSISQEGLVDVVRLSRLRDRNTDGTMFAPTRLAFHFIQFVTVGEGTHWVDFERVSLQAGDVLHIRPEQVHSFARDAEHEALLLFFMPGAPLQAHIPQHARWQANTVLRPTKDDSKILNELVCLQEVLCTSPTEMRPSSVGPYLLGAILAGLANIVNAQQGSVDLTAQRYEGLVLDFETLLDEHFLQSRAPKWYAAKLATTSRTLARACRQSRDRSPKQMIDLRVLLAAKRQLTTTTDTVEAIGYSLGFSEPTNFVKYFKRIGGVTPDSFRRSHGTANL